MHSDDGDIVNSMVVGHRLVAFSEAPYRLSERWTITYWAPQEAYT